jgi:mannosyl-3-phosphoglycerate phosphatase
VREVLITDVDGCLLAPDDPAGGAITDEVRETLSALRRHRVLVILASSKTDAELIALQHDLGIKGPRIVENGSALRGTGSKDRSGSLEWPAFDHLLRAALASCGLDTARLSSVATAEAERITGLKGNALARARRREFTDTLLVKLDEGQRACLIDQLRTAGLSLQRGTRFETVTGSSASKGEALGWWLSGQPPVRTVGIGDGLNDLPFLVRVDRGILLGQTGAAAGPAGWCAAVRASFEL